jgi:hypothetical protein
MLMRLASLATAVILTGVVVGQVQAAGGIALPKFFNPPPPRQQVADAQVWDPYPMPDIGAGPADSARPRDFQYPPPEATRGRVWQGAAGTFPRSQPWLRSQAPVDYPNIRKRLISSRRTAPVSDAPVDAGPALQSPDENAPAHDAVNEGDSEAVPAPAARQSGTRRLRSRGESTAPAD